MGSEPPGAGLSVQHCLVTTPTKHSLTFKMKTKVIDLFYPPFSFVLSPLQPLVFCCGKLQPMVCPLTLALTCLKSMSCWRKTTAWSAPKAVLRKSMSSWEHVSVPQPCKCCFLALQKCNKSARIWPHRSRHEKPPASCSEGATLCRNVWLKLLSPEDEHMMKPTILLYWEHTGLGETCVVHLTVFFVSFSLTT